MANRDGDALVEPPLARNQSALPASSPGQDASEGESEGSHKGDDAHSANGRESGTHIDGGDEASRLRALATNVRDQDDLERDVGLQVYSSFIAC